MRKNLLPWASCLAAAFSFINSSCTYDPYYSSAGGYYGEGYGYGSSSFSTSLFVTTGDPRWGYDPYTYCYYDYRSRRYYDPYLYGYYPVGYRPYAVHGAPHPHGWRPGLGHCPPPRTVRDVVVVNYRNRESAYRNSNYSWARQVKPHPTESHYRHSSGGSRVYDSRRGDTRTDFRTRQIIDRDSLNSRTWTPRETGQPREYTPDFKRSRDRIQRDDFRPTGHLQPQESDRSGHRQPSRGLHPESTHVQPTPHPQPARQIEPPSKNQHHGGDQPRGRFSPPDPFEKKSDSFKSKYLRRLGDA